MRVKILKILCYFVYLSEVIDPTYGLGLCENNVLSYCKCETGQTKTVAAITVGPMGTPTGVIVGPHDITEICMSCKSKTKIIQNR